MIAVITGATQGIGRATATRFAKEGFDLIITARNAKDLSKTKAEIEKKFKVKVDATNADFSNIEEVKKFGKFVKSNTKKVDVLVNNVGQYMVGDLFYNSTEKFME